MPGPQTPKIQTLRQAKAAYNRRPAGFVSESERRRNFRRAEQDERAAQLREKEKKRIDNKKKRAEKEMRDRETRRRMGRLDLQKDADDGDRVTGKWGVLGSQLKLNFNKSIKATNKRKAEEMEDEHEEPETEALDDDAVLAALSEDEDEYEVKESAGRLGYHVAKRLPQLERLLPKSAPRSPSASIQVMATSDPSVAAKPPTTTANTGRTHIADSFGPQFDTPPLGQGTRKTTPTQTKATQTPSSNAKAMHDDLDLLAAIPSSELNQITSSPSVPSTWAGMSSLLSSPKKDAATETDFLDDEDTAWMDALEPDEMSLLGDLLSQLSQENMPPPPLPRSTSSKKHLGASLTSPATHTPAPTSFTFGSQWVSTQDLLAMEQEAQ